MADPAPRNDDGGVSDTLETEGAGRSSNWIPQQTTALFDALGVARDVWTMYAKAETPEAKTGARTSLRPGDAEAGMRDEKQTKYNRKIAYWVRRRAATRVRAHFVHVIKRTRRHQTGPSAMGGITSLQSYQRVLGSG